MDCQWIGIGLALYWHRIGNGLALDWLLVDIGLGIDRHRIGMNWYWIGIRLG